MGQTGAAKHTPLVLGRLLLLWRVKEQPENGNGRLHERRHPAVVDAERLAEQPHNRLGQREHGAVILVDDAPELVGPLYLLGVLVGAEVELVGYYHGVVGR